jgi:hypothetical protein
MKRENRFYLSYALFISLLFCKQMLSMVQMKERAAQYEWAVVGAGPGGIVVVGLLLDLGINPKQIAWIDPEFSVGRLANYTNVPANSTVKSFFDFLQACNTFCACSPSLDALIAYGFDKEPPLGELVLPLQEITNYLCSSVVPVRSMLRALDFIDDQWQVTLNNQTLTAQRVVLATGSHPRSMDYDCGSEISLDVALDKAQLAQCVSPADSIAVVGSAHSAVLVMKALSELPVARIINFYTTPLQYVIDMGSWVLHAESGLKGIAAEWARTVLEKNPPANLVRVINSEASRTAWLPICNKVIYASGFERNDIPPINGSTAPITYNPTTGIIAPHLFGIGIAFPEVQIDPLGNKEHRVGLNSFMAYALRVTPEWLHKDLHRFTAFEKLFAITVL